MNVFDALLKSYNYAEVIGLVDNDSYDALLLPIYHSKLRSNGTNIIQLDLNKDSTLFRASFLNQYSNEANEKNKISEYIVFPVTKDSASRSGKKAPSHALVDKIKYIFDEEGNLLGDYKSYLEEWIDFEYQSNVYQFLRIIFDFLSGDHPLEKITSSITYDDNASIDGYLVNDGDNILDLSDIFVEFNILSFDGDKNVSVSSYKDLHKSFIEFTNHMDKANGICNLSGNYEYITKKHRGLLGNAKLISVSNNKEAYIGRLNKDTSSLNIGRETSEKIHLMLSYLIENKNSSLRIAESQYLITWFSEDIRNSNQIDITYNKSIYADFDIIKDTSKENKVSPANVKTNLVNQSFKLGRAEYSGDSQFYCMVIDSFNPGRVVIKYFDALSVSELEKRLKSWEAKYSWDRYDSQIDDFKPYTPSFYSIFMNAYGIERDENNSKKLAYDNKKFLNNQYVSMITSLINGQNLPNNITNKFEQNIRYRNRYKDEKVWNNLLLVARAVLKNKNQEGFTRMLDKENTDRSYLLGRLLSIYHNIEQITYGDSQRLTNAEKYWSNFLDRPMTTLNILEKKTNPYMNRLKNTNYRMYEGLQAIKNNVINIIGENYNIEEKSFNMPLDYKFLFGYTAQNSSIYGMNHQVNKEYNND